MHEYYSSITGDKQLSCYCKAVLRSICTAVELESRATGNKMLKHCYFLDYEYKQYACKSLEILISELHLSYLNV